MSKERYHINFSPEASAFLEAYATHSRKAKYEVGLLLGKAEAFDAVGLAECRSACEIRCVGQHEVLPIPCGRLYAFAELKNLRRTGEIFMVVQVETYGELRRSWINVHTHFGYEGPLPFVDRQRTWGYEL